ncbi:3724_t:CDS:1 [Dentiscutata heterogama]|uniref:3724_t:CDS:1 n=1 Tax=Dentiscutata heterogama TaxID=1316150 RepID=A0ACA9M172_9GLOM|nr:3724_t:CDS:1 [Dentiscutata heterogama]
MLDEIESSKNIQDLKIDILQGIKYIIQGWNKVTENTIKNCWRHTKLISFWDNHADIDENEEESLEEPLLEELFKNIEDLNFSDSMQVEEYLNIPDENIIYEVSNNNQIISDLIETFRERSDKIEYEDPEKADDSVEREIVKPSEAFKSLDNIHTFLLQQKGVNECIKLVSIIEKFITTRKNDLMTQSKIDKYFNINVDRMEELQSLDDLDDLMF